MNLKILPCPYGAKIHWRLWHKHKLDFKYLQCEKQSCMYADWDCRSEAFLEEEAVIIDWNRKVTKRLRFFEEIKNKEVN